MIGRPVKGTGFRGVLNYLGDKEHARLLGGNMAGRNPRELAREFGILRRQRPALKRAVAHMFLRPAPGEYFTDSEWRRIASYYLAGMGFADSPHVLYLDSKPHPHLHLLASRITYSGGVVSDSNDYARSAELLRNIERQYGLRIVSAHPEFASPKPGDYGRSRRTSIPPLKTRLQKILADVSYPLTLPEYLTYLHQQGVTMLPNIARTGRISGISYVYEGQVMKASDLGRGHSWNALLRRLHSHPDDPALLVAERDLAEKTLAAAAPSPPVPEPRELASTGLQESALFNSLARAEEALLEATPDTYVGRALEYSFRASQAEHLITSSLDTAEPHSRQAEALAEALLSETGPPPTAQSLDRLLRENEAARALVLTLRFEALREEVDGFDGPPAIAPATDPEIFRQAIERDLDARRALHRIELGAEVRLQESSLDLHPEEQRQLARAAELLRDRVELSRVDRHLDLIYVERHLSTDREIDELEGRAADLQAKISSLKASLATAQETERKDALPSVDEAPRTPTEADPSTPAAEPASQILSDVRAARAELLSASPEPFEERLLAYLQSANSARADTLDYLHSRISFAGEETLLSRLSEAAPLNLTYVESLERDALPAFRAILAEPASPEAGELDTFLTRYLELDRAALQAAAGQAELLPRRSETSDELDRETTYLQVIEQRAQLYASHYEREILETLVERDPRYRVDLDRVESRIAHLQEGEYLEYLPRPTRVAELEPESFEGPSGEFPRHVIDVEILDGNETEIADAFRSSARFSPDPPVLLAPTRDELPGLAVASNTSLAQYAAAERALRDSIPETYPSLALSHAADAVAAERVNQELSTFNPEPIPRDLPEERLLSYLETRLQIHEALAAPPSRNRDQLVAALEERIGELHPGGPAPVRADLPRLLEEHREAYREVEALLSASASDPGAFRAAVARALDRHAELEQVSFHLEGHLQAKSREHAILATRLGPEAAAENSHLLALERQIGRIEPLYLETRIEIADRDLELLERHLRARPSSETLDRYTELLQDRGLLVLRLREERSEHRTPRDPAVDLRAARQTFLEDPSEASLRGYRLAVLAATESGERGSFARDVANVSLRRTELRAALLEIEHPEGRSLPLPDRQADLRKAASRYVDARQGLADHAPRPPRRGTTFDYAAHAEATQLSPAALDRLRRKAYLDFKRNPSPNPITKPRAVEPHLSRKEALPRAVKRLQAREAALTARLKGIKRLGQRKPPSERTTLSPETNRRLVSSIDAYQQALADVERLSRSRIPLSPREFLKHAHFNRRPLQALAAWTGYATRKGVPPSQIGRALRAFGVPFVAGTAVRAAQSAVSRFFQDQVHER